MTALENFLLHAYLNNELDNEAAEAFELLLIERPDLAAIVDADTALHLGLASESRESSVTSIGATTDAVESTLKPLPAGNMPSRRAPRRYFVSPALAAGIALVVGVGAGYMLMRQAPVDRLESMQLATLVHIDRSRSTSADLVFKLPDSGWVVLLTPALSVDSCTPQITLRQPPKAALRGSAPVDEFGYASLALPRAAIDLGEAKVEMHCGTAAPAIYSVRFESTAKANTGL